MSRSEVKSFDPRQRAAAKQAARDRDAKALAQGRKSPRQLHRDNGVLALAREDVQIDLAGFINAGH
jgi:hypothetical protein